MSSKLATAVVVDDSQIFEGNTIDAANHTTPLGDSQSELREGWSKVSSGDTYVKHLEDAIIGASGKTKLTKLNSAGNEQLEIDLDATGVTNAYAPLANGSGGWAWGNPGGGGASPIDIAGTAGEALALRDYVYLDESDGKWYKVDIDAIPVKCGRIRGIVNESGGIAASSTGSIRLLGEVSGYTGLTAWQPVYASTTAGVFTQTRPSPTSGGAQVAIIEVGIAISTTNVVLLPQKTVLYMKRDDALANDGTLTIQHHKDEMGHTRLAKAYISSTDAGVAIEEYSSTNQDTQLALEIGALSGSSTSYSASASQTFVGDSSGTEYRSGQSFQLSADGQLSQFTFDLIANTGSPTGDLSWEIRDDNSGEPGSTIIASGSIPNGSVTPSATNTVNISGGPVLAAATTYWLILFADAQSTDNRWNWEASNPGSYANGQRAYSSDGGSTWTTDGRDMSFSVTASATTTKEKLSQSFTLSSSEDIASVLLYLRKVGAPTGTLTLRIETDSAGDPSGTLAHANATTTLGENSLGTSLADIAFTFASSFTLSAGTYHIVLDTNRTASSSNYVEWGADESSPGYAGGEGKSYASSTWSAESVDFIFAVYIVGTTFAEPCTIGRWGGGTRDIAVRYDDGTSANGDTQTTFKNVIGATADLTAVLEIP